MGKIAILHLSDLHYSEQNQPDKDIIIDALIRDIPNVVARVGCNIDLVAFTGDLIFSADNPEDFRSAKVRFLEPVLAACNLDFSRLAIVPGNHDISRRSAKSVDFVESGLASTLTTVASVNAFIDRTISEDGDYKPAFTRLHPFNQFIASLPLHPHISANNFYRTYSIDIRGTTIGLACFSTAWRSRGDGEEEKTQLLLGERTIDNSLRDLRDCNIKFALYHHPTDWLKSFDSAAVDARLLNGFDVLFSGHNHSAQPYYKQSPNGRSVVSQVGCLYESRDYTNGYQVICINPLTLDVSYFGRTYFDRRREFGISEDITKDGTISYQLTPRTETEKDIQLERFLQQGRIQIREEALRHIAFDESEIRNIHSIQNVFVCPPLHKQADKSEDAPDGKDTTSTSKITVEEILTSGKNYQIKGARESGKSSLIHFLAVKIAEGGTGKTALPVIVDFKGLRRRSNILRRVVRSYYSTLPPGFDAVNLVERYGAIFLVDNFDPDDTAALAGFESLRQSVGHSIWICFGDDKSEIISVIGETPAHLSGFERVKIESLPRTSIRTLSKNWGLISRMNPDGTFDAVMKQIQSANLPRTGYIASLILWAIYKQRDLDQVNEAALLQNILDYLLEKADFTASLRKEFDYRSKQLLLQAIAHFLYGCDGTAFANDVLQFTIGFFKEKSLEFDASKILDGFLSCGILTKQDDFIAFKYRCFQEFFHAEWLHENSAAVKQILDEGNILKFNRELDFMSALVRRDEEFLKRVEEVVFKKMPEKVAATDLSEFLKFEIAAAVHDFLRERLDEIKKIDITQEYVDELLDRAENETKLIAKSYPRQGEDGNIDGQSSEMRAVGVFGGNLSLYGKIIRNSEFISGTGKREHIEKFFDAQSKICLWLEQASLKAISDDDVRSARGLEPLSPVQKEAAEYLCKVVVPLIISYSSTHHIGTPKLAPIYEDVAKDQNKPFLVRLMCAFTLLDLRPDGWDQILRDLLFKGQTVSNYVYTVVAEKMYAVMSTTYLLDQDRARVENLLADIQIQLNMLPRGAKGAAITRMSAAGRETRRRGGRGTRKRGKRSKSDTLLSRNSRKKKS